MKIKDMPDWVLKYKTKGYTVRFQAGQFSLIKVTSVRTPDKPYPQLIQEHIGVITEKDGLIPKKIRPDEEGGIVRLEYGLSYFLYLNFKRDLKRHIYSNEGEINCQLILTASIIQYLFEDIDEQYLTLTHLPRITGIDNFQNLTPKRRATAIRLEKRMKESLEQAITDEPSRRSLLFELRSVTLPSEADCSKDWFSQSLKAEIKHWGYRFE